MTTANTTPKTLPSIESNTSSQHYHDGDLDSSSLTLPRLTSRAPRGRPNIRPINTCPPHLVTAVEWQYNEFVSSECNAGDASHRSYTLRCAYNDPTYDYLRYHMDFQRRCHAWEMCFQARGPLQNDPQNNNVLEAWCVSYYSFVNLAQRVLGPEQPQRRRSVRLQLAAKRRKLDPGGKNFLDLVVLSAARGHGGMKPLKVENITIQPLQADRKPVGQAEQCADCARLGMSPWPKGTTYFDVDVMLLKEHDGASLNYFWDRLGT